MTFSILVRDPLTGTIGGAAATGSLCVGGWVLRGDIRAGVSASQGAAPSTFWGQDVLGAMQGGLGADAAVQQITDADPGRDYRQLSALGLTGAGAAFTGRSNTPQMGAVAFADGILAGNMLANLNVLDAMGEGFGSTHLPFDQRLIAALRAGHRAGGDSRGLLSAALLVLHPDHAPLSLRIDFAPKDPIGALEALRQRATSGDYADWARQVPSPSDPYRVLD